MERYVVEDDYPYVELLGRYVRPGQRVRPGTPLYEIMTPGGAVIIRAKDFGEVAHIEGPKITRNSFEDMFDEPDLRADGNSDWVRYRGMGWIYPRGDLLCQVLDRQGNKNSQTNGLRPNTSTRVSRRREAGINLN